MVFRIKQPTSGPWAGQKHCTPGLKIMAPCFYHPHLHPPQLHGAHLQTQPTKGRRCWERSLLPPSSSADCFLVSTPHTKQHNHHVTRCLGVVWTVSHLGMAQTDSVGGFYADTVPFGMKA